MKLNYYTAERLRLAQRIANAWAAVPAEQQFLWVLAVALWAAVAIASTGVTP